MWIKWNCIQTPISSGPTHAVQNTLGFVFLQVFLQVSSLSLFCYISYFPLWHFYFLGPSDVCVPEKQLNEKNSGIMSPACSQGYSLPRMFPWVWLGKRAAGIKDRCCLLDMSWVGVLWTVVMSEKLEFLLYHITNMCRSI